MVDSPVVLLIDDSQLNLKLLEIMFVREGIKVYKAESGAEGRELARIHHPDLVLLDIMMPGENGFETCAALKAESSTADIPVLFASAVDDDDQRIKGTALGAVDYVSKPYNRTEIITKTRHYALHRNPQG
jgi:phosphoserine phosphatase RsbU/P